MSDLWVEYPATLTNWGNPLQRWWHRRFGHTRCIEWDMDDAPIFCVCGLQLMWGDLVVMGKSS